MPRRSGRWRHRPGSWSTWSRGPGRAFSMPSPRSTASAMAARKAAALLLLLLALAGLAGHAHARQRVVFVDKTFLEVEDAWPDDKYVHFVYQGRPITVLRSDVARIEGARSKTPPRAAPACPPPRPGDDDQAVR